MTARASTPRYWGLVPAAGVGARMGAAIPKQYLPLLGKPILLHTLERLGSHPQLSGVLVGISSSDGHWPGLPRDLPKLLGTFEGGAERAATVLNGLQALSAHAAPTDRVLVHDAVRPCLRHTDIDSLIRIAGAHPDGGLLGLPLTDTIKRADATDFVQETVARDGLWRALTPQLFRLDVLTAALERALRDGVAITDEAAAVEHAGGRPRMVAGHADNIKITLPADLMTAERNLRQQAGEIA